MQKVFFDFEANMKQIMVFFGIVLIEVDSSQFSILKLLEYAASVANLLKKN